MDRRHSPFCFSQLISAAQYIEKARSVPDTCLISDESSGDSFVTKGVLGQSTTCSVASTSSLGCSSDRSSSIPSPRHFPTPPPEYSRRHRPYPSVTSARHSRHIHLSGHIRRLNDCTIRLTPHVEDPLAIDRNPKAAHNELEKTRRANLRGYLDNLKDIVPPSSDNARNTTLSLLTRARDYILELDRLVKNAEEQKHQLEKRHSTLQLMLEGLHHEKGLTLESRSESASTVSAVDDNEYGILSSSASSSSSLAFSDNTSCIDFGSKLSVSSSSSSLVSSPVHPYPPFDPYLNGLLPALPLCYPRISMYPYLDVQPL
uniref:BHLH domain-containing protein n=1 Tax=Setaria digitata TaxID=48799 RepID=A0A915PUB0_9BILA